MRRRRWLIVPLLLALPILGWLGLRWLLQPERLGRLALEQAEQTLALELAVGAPARLGVWPRLHLQLTDLTARSRDTATPMLTARAAEIELPWRVLYAGLQFGPLHLHGPTLDLAAFSAWRTARRSDGPAAPWRLPRIAGVIIDDGHIVGADWQLRDLRLHADPIAPDAASDIRLAGEFVRGAQQVPLQGTLTLTPRQRNGALDAELAFSGHAGALHWRGHTELTPLLAWLENADWQRPPPLQLQGEAETIEFAGIRIEGLTIRSDAEAVTHD